MSTLDRSELLSIAREKFQENDYKTAEVLLQQILLSNKRNAEVFQMLGTIYYDQGKFNKAVKTFKRALEIDPMYTDASIGLSIILNDLGRYEEGQSIFEEAQRLLEKKTQNTDPYIEEKLAIKHEELGQLYFQCKRYKEALDQYLKAAQLSTRIVEITMKCVDCHEALGDFNQAIKNLKFLANEYPQFTQARIKLGKILYNSGQVVEASTQWESVLLRDPENPEALQNLRIAQETGITSERYL